MKRGNFATIFYLTPNIQNIILSCCIGKHVINIKSFKGYFTMFGLSDLVCILHLQYSSTWTSHISIHK